MATGWKLIDDVYYYFDDQGAMYRDRFFEYDKNTYYVDADGKWHPGSNRLTGSGITSEAGAAWHKTPF